MPANLDEAGDNPFFMGHHEGPSVGKTRFPSVSAKQPMDSVQWAIRRYLPGITPYLKDWIWKAMEQEGLMELAGKDGFKEKVRVFMEDFKETNLKVVEAHITKAGDKDGVKESE